MHAMYISFCSGCFFKLARGLPQIAPCLEHVCVCVWVCVGGGGNVAIEVFTCIHYKKN